MMIIDQFVKRQQSTNKKSQLKKVFLQNIPRLILIILTMDQLDLFYQAYSTTRIKQALSLNQEQKINANNIYHRRYNHFPPQHQIYHKLQLQGERNVQIPNVIIKDYFPQFFDKIDLIRDHRLPRWRLIYHFIRCQLNKYQQIPNIVIKCMSLSPSQIYDQWQKIYKEKDDIQNFIKIIRQPDLPSPNIPLQSQLLQANIPIQTQFPQANIPIQLQLPQANIPIKQKKNEVLVICQQIQDTTQQISTKIKNIVNTYVPKAQYKLYYDGFMIRKYSYRKIKSNDQEIGSKQKDINCQKHESQAKRDNSSEPSTDTVQHQPHSGFQTQYRYKKKILLGETAVGKTSLVNFYFKSHFAIGMGDCTSQIIEVKRYRQIKIYDSNPLLISQFHDYSSQEYLQYCKYDEIYFLYCTSLKNISKFIKKIIELKSPSHKIYFIRTKCDNFDSKQLKTYKQQIQTDQNLLIDWGLKSNQISIFGVSVKDKKMSAFDNKIVYNLLVN